MPTLMFTFNQIMLPDSNVNEPASHGFLHFSISPFDSLPQGAVIENDAGIYFDYNAPIITNTVLNTINDTFLVNFDPNLITICGEQPTVAFTGGDTTFCGWETDTIPLIANQPLKGSGSWKIISGTGQINNPFNYVTYVTGLGAGENIFQWEIRLCDSLSKSQIMINRDTFPEKPEIVSINGEFSFCEGDSIQLAGPEGLLMYQWSNGAQSRYQIFKDPGVFSLSVINSNGCQSPWADSVYVVKNETPEVPTILPVGSDSLTASNDASVFLWYLNGEKMEDSTRQIKPGATGEYQLIIIDQNGCISEISDPYFFSTTSIKSEWIGTEFDVFPNPVQSLLSIISRRNLLFNVRLIDVYGKNIYVKKDQSLRMDLNLVSVSSGVYFLILEQNGEEYRTKIRVLH